MKAVRGECVVSIAVHDESTSRVKKGTNTTVCMHEQSRISRCFP
jgi:hypothetical protein